MDLYDCARVKPAVPNGPQYQTISQNEIRNSTPRQKRARITGTASSGDGIDTKLDGEDKLGRDVPQRKAGRNNGFAIVSVALAGLRPIRVELCRRPSRMNDPSLPAFRAFVGREERTTDWSSPSRFQHRPIGARVNAQSKHSIVPTIGSPDQSP
jgi:hypothetical protein